MSMSTGGGGADSHSLPKADINTTPLVDVMLVLLIIFMITAPLMQNKIQVTLPSASSQPEGQEASDGPKVTLSIVKNGSQAQYFWDDQLVTMETLTARMQGEAKRTNNKIQLRIRADRSLKYEDISIVLKTAKDTGVQHVAFVSAPEPKG